MNKTRSAVAVLSLSAAALVAMLGHEGYTDRAIQPLPGDKWTNGFGTTTRTDGSPLQPGEATTPVKALARALVDIQRFEGALRQCVRVPLLQNEYDAFLSLAYNIGPNAFCGSTLARKLNAGDYPGACREILRWDKFQGQPVRGLTLRREAEFKQCMETHQ